MLDGDGGVQEQDTELSLTVGRVASIPYLTQAFEHLLRSFEGAERLLDLESGSMGFRGPGIVALTNRRLLFVMSRKLLPGIRMWSCDYHRVSGVEERSWAGNTELRVYYDHEVAYFPIVGSAARAKDLAGRIAECAGIDS